MGTITKKFSEKYYGFLFHYYRAEVYRETVWRNRLDVTTNWSIVITAAILSFEFSNPGVSHAVIITNYLIVWFFLYIEARRFRYYFSIHDRVKMFEKGVLGPLFIFDNKNNDSDKWIEKIGDKLINTRISMSRIESLSWRLRRVYIFILPLIFLVWVYKVSIFPVNAMEFSDLIINAKVGFVSGIIIWAFMISSLFSAFIIAFYVSRKHVGNDLP